MPYIDQKIRAVLDPYKGFGAPETAGQLNFMLSRMLKEYMDGKKRKNEFSYQTLNDISGAMTEALAEFRRMVIVPYENARMTENGVVY